MPKLGDIINKINENKANEPIIGKAEIAKAVQKLTEYKNGKVNLENRIVNDEQFYKLQHWGYLNSLSKNQDADKEVKKRPTTAWMLNSIVNKHADLMDNYPEAICLPREKSDEEDAKMLSEIIPVVIEHNDYEDVYSDAVWYYIKHGTSCQGVFWDSSKENGLGDITIKNVDILNLFWEPGITNIQESQNLFYVSLVDSDELSEAYPNIKKNKLSGNAITVKDYIYDDSIDNSNKSLVVDWYYKKRVADGRQLLHYVKFVGDTILFASENEQGYENGFYEHGEFPFTIARMYPEAGTPFGFGIISVCRDPQMYIDTLDGYMLDYVKKITNPRFYAKKNVGINIKEFEDWSKSFVYVDGDFDEEKLKQINLQPLGAGIQNLREMKVNELKETSSNRDFSQGGTSAGITSGAAIATLQEAGNKTSRDMIKSLYRSYVDVIRLTIELIRQFYDEERTFRITGKSGEYEFIRYSNQGIKEQEMVMPTGDTMYRRPVFDIDVKAQKTNPYSKMSQNETASNLYQMGIFAPQNAQQALIMLEMMDFEGKEKVREYVMQGQTLQNIVNQQQQQMAQMAQIIEKLTGESLMGDGESLGMDTQKTPGKGRKNPIETANDNARDLHLNEYGKKLAQKARPDVSKG